MIDTQLAAIGFSSIQEFLTRNQCLSYWDLAEALSESDRLVRVLPIDVIEASTRDALRNGYLAWMLRDALTRIFVERFPEGWPGPGAGVGSLRVGLVVFGTHLKDFGVDPGVARAFLETCLRIQAPQGWKPSGPDDPLVISLLKSVPEGV